ncbi:MAG: aldose 1-epimerase family protein [Pirellulales bacterium]
MCSTFRSILAVIFLFPAATSIFAREGDEFGTTVLTSAKQSIDRQTWSGSGDGWSVSKRTLHGGKQEGVEVITIDNGVLQIDIVPTRGMNIQEIRRGKTRLGWDSPVKELVHPAFIDLESRGGLGWLDGFNEWMVRCGLEFAGHPGTDTIINNTGDSADIDLTLHGKIGNIPASEVEVRVDKKPPHRIEVRGVVYERSFKGPNLRLVAAVSTVPGESAFRIDDEVTNLGAADQEFQIIYHMNFGAPLLEQGAKVHVAPRKIAPMNDHAAENIDGFSTYPSPTDGYIEEVYLVEPYSDDQGLSSAVLQDAAGNNAASIRWSTKQLPYLTLWKNTASQAEGYVTGIEPGTGFPFNRRIERAAGRVPKLKPGESRRFSLDIGLASGKSAVQDAIRAVEKIRGDRPVEVQRTPPVTDAK